jgi:hypothetical protein
MISYFWVTVSLILILIILLTLFLPTHPSIKSQSLTKEYPERKSNSKKYNNKDLSYEDLLKCKEWREKRQKILNRDNNKCVYCGEVHNLQVHHKYYSKYPNGFRVYPWNYPDDALITLCDRCHKKVHNKKKIKTYYRNYSDNY